jgi:GR25 family glycosyltransferase involved in LPS biosynthesis
MVPEKIFLINLDVRVDRMNAFQAQESLWRRTFGCFPIRVAAVSGLSIPGYGKLPWFRDRITDRRRRSWAGKAGCILSHRAVIQEAQRTGAGSVLIVEDDALLIREAAQLWEKTIKGWIEQLGDDWVAIYLCSSKPRQPIRVATCADEIRLLEVFGASNTVACLLNGRVFPALLDELPDQRSVWRWVARHKAIDRWYSRNLNRFGRVYVCSPSIVLQQQIGRSDITMTNESAEHLDYGHRDVGLVDGNISFKVRYYLVQIQSHIGRGFSLMRLFIRRIRGL